MSHGNGRSNAPQGYSPEFARRIADWIEENPQLIGGLCALRALGVGGAPAVEAVLAIRSVRKLTLSWELWAALVEGDGHDAEELLLEHVGVMELFRVRHALWGDPDPGAAPSLGAV